MSMSAALSNSTASASPTASASISASAGVSNSSHPSIWVSDGNCSASVYLGVQGRDLDPKDNFTLCSATYSLGPKEETHEPDLTEIQACCFESEGDYSCERNNCLMRDAEHVEHWKACVKESQSNLYSCTVYPIHKKPIGSGTRLATRTALVLSVAMAVVATL